MQKKTAIIISPNWRDYAKKYLDDCLDSLVKQDYIGECKYFFIDNESTEESFAFFKRSIEKILPTNFDREIIRIAHNSGFAEANNEAMKLALEQNYNYIILLNIDTIADFSTIKTLVETAESDPSIGAVQPRLMLWPDKEKINSLGNATHFLGFGFSNGYGELFQNSKFKIQNLDAIFYPSGAAVLFRAEVLKQIGLFDEEFWMYAEDQDLGWRIWLAGYKCVLSPEAIVYHKYEFSRSISKYYWMDRNRFIVLFKNFKIATLLLIFPALLIMEIGLLLFSIKGGWFKEKLSVYKYLLKPTAWKYLIKTRQDTQKLRKIKDRELVPMLSSKIAYQEIDSPALKIANVIFTIYWKLLNKIIIW